MPTILQSVACDSNFGNRISHLTAFHLLPFYLEAGYCHGKVMISVSVWVKFLVGVRVMAGVRMEYREKCRNNRNF